MKLYVELDINKLDVYSKNKDLPMLHDNNGNFSSFYLGLSDSEQYLILRLCQAR